MHPSDGLHVVPRRKKRLETFANRANLDALEQQSAKETHQGNNLIATILSTMSPLWSFQGLCLLIQLAKEILIKRRARLA